MAQLLSKLYVDKLVIQFIPFNPHRTHEIDVLLSLFYQIEIERF
jgi:hypothetical protein